MCHMYDLAKILRQVPIPIYPGLGPALGLHWLVTPCGCVFKSSFQLQWPSQRVDAHVLTWQTPDGLHGATHYILV